MFAFYCTPYGVYIITMRSALGFRIKPHYIYPQAKILSNLHKQLNQKVRKDTLDTTSR